LHNPFKVWLNLRESDPDSLIECFF
jgi:hypothetical protein